MQTNNNLLNTEAFFKEMYKRVVLLNDKGEKRDKKGRDFWDIQWGMFSDSYASSLVYRAYTSGLYYLSDINSQTMGRAEEVYDETMRPYRESGEGFGSSDYTFMIKSFLSAEGIEADFIGSYLTRLSPKQIKEKKTQSMIYTALNFSIKNYTNEYIKKIRKVMNALMEKGYVKTRKGKDIPYSSRNPEYQLVKKDLTIKQLAEVISEGKITSFKNEEGFYLEGGNVLKNWCYSVGGL